VNQTQDFSFPAPGSDETGQSENSVAVPVPKLALYLRAPSVPGVGMVCFTTVLNLRIFLIVIKFCSGMLHKVSK